MPHMERILKQSVGKHGSKSIHNGAMQYYQTQNGSKQRRAGQSQTPYLNKGYDLSPDLDRNFDMEGKQEKV